MIEHYAFVADIHAECDLSNPISNLISEEL